MSNKKTWKLIDWITTIFVIVGGLNWGLVALDFNLVEALPIISNISKIVYGLVGISTIYIVIRGAMKKFMK